MRCYHLFQNLTYLEFPYPENGLKLSQYEVEKRLMDTSGFDIFGTVTMIVNISVRCDNTFINKTLLALHSYFAKQIKYIFMYFIAHILQEDIHGSHNNSHAQNS